ncbi:hypothetical protein AAGG74_16725 [Bacillus mexicanus]|uniref:hypothetical protein n=1 Tax=Bacillus mexicanus TaxID=2834415 RepID=UPI003D23E79F
MGKRLIFSLVSGFLLLAGCTHITSNDQHSTREKDVSKESFKDLINQVKKIRETNKLDNLKNVAYKNSPYFNYVSFLIKNKNIESGKTSVKFSNFKVVKKQNNIGVVYVDEHMVTEGKGSNLDSDASYYYFFKKENKEWRIYDYLPSTAVNNIDDLIKRYQ